MSENTICITDTVTPPGWALWERRLLDDMAWAAREFVRRYTRPDGTLVWRESWPGMDGSDDAYESFFNFPLLAALGGDLDLDALARAEWEAITRQFSAYGQVYREFDAYYDWMHHGESSLLFYYFGLCRPDDLRMRARALRFAAMYTGEDAEAPNYDPALRLIRSPITGSRGPRFENSAEDWVTHRPVLADYPAPFDDIPGIAPGARADWNDDRIFGEILTLMNRRMMRGDVPLNLTATSLIANAFLYTGDPKYRDWVLGYLAAWQERAGANGGILPDNVGPSGIVGECFDGRWWGGYYGWKWPHGFMSLIEPTVIAGANALLLGADRTALDLSRQLLDAVYSAGHSDGETYVIPHRRGDSGWYDFRPLHRGVHASVSPAVDYPIHLWYLSMEADDQARVERWLGSTDTAQVQPGRGKGDCVHTANWYGFLQGRNESYPETILRVNHAEFARRCSLMLHDDTDPETWDVHHWQDRNPVICEGLVQLMLGAPQVVYHGGLLHCRVRYFDADRRCPGLPRDVAALVRKVDAQGIEVELVNLNPLEARRVILQAGAFSEHRFTDAVFGGRHTTVESAHLQVELQPGAGGTLRLQQQRYADMPTYQHP